MTRSAELCKLPLYFDPVRLTRELSQLREADWRPDSLDAAGDASVVLVSAGGTFNHDFAISGPMQPTAFLEQCPYIAQIIAALGAPISRCRLSRLTPGAKTPLRGNDEYHWFRRAPVYVPIVTDPAVKLVHNDKHVHMAAGEAWTFDNSLRHGMLNEAEQACIHLVIEVRVSQAFQELRSHAAKQASTGNSPHGAGARHVPYVPDRQAEIPVEVYSFEVLTTEEVVELTEVILAEANMVEMPPGELAGLVQSTEEFRSRWAEAFARFGHDPAGELTYQTILLDFQKHIGAKAAKVAEVARRLQGAAGHGKRAAEIIRSMLLTSPSVMSRHFLHQLKNRQPKLPVEPRHAKATEHTIEPQEDLGFEFDRPLFIVSAPRAGSTLLFEALSRLPMVWTIGEESHEVIEGIPALHPAAHGYQSNCLSEKDASPAVAAALRTRFARKLRDRDGRLFVSLPVQERPKSLRFLEKTPKNALRIPFLNAVFANARFIYLYREPMATISSLMEGWRSRRFIAYRQLPGWPFKDWSYLLPPGWASLQDCSIAEIAAYQWNAANSHILDALESLPRNAWHLVHYSELTHQTEMVVKRIGEFAELAWDDQVEQRFSSSLPVSRLTLSGPSSGKWRRNEKAIATVLPSLQRTIRRVELLGMSGRSLPMQP